MESSIDLYKGLLYYYPSKPSKKNILNWDKPQKDQKWVRTPLPNNWEDLSDEQQLDFAQEEDRKCSEGVWVFINGVETYLTGDHYFYLNWFMIDSGYPDYRDRDRRWFYHWELCDKDENCLGQAYGKLRRDGYSYRVDSLILNRARKTFNSKYGIISKTGEDAKEMFNKLIHGFIELPDFFKPQVQSAEDVKKELVFKTPQKRVTFKTRKTAKELSLNTSIDWRNTKENAYDGMKLKLVAVDESGKFPKDVSIEKWFSIGKTCLVLGGTIIGKMLFGSTVNETDKGGEGFFSIWGNSLHSEKTENNRTISGLWRYFVPSADGMEGFIDEYGMSVIKTPETPVKGIDGKLIKKGAEQWIMDELQALKDKGNNIAYYEFKRQFPLTEDDMFINPANEKVVFDVEKIQQQLDYNKIHIVKDEIISGYLQWEQGDRETFKVMFVHTPHDSHLAKFRYAFLPITEERNKYNIGRTRKKEPANAHIGLSTLDPYAAVNTIDTRGSKAASHLFYKHNFMGAKNKSYCFVGEYWNRLSDPLLVYEDMIMQCVFWGFPLLGERNIKTCNDYFRNRDMDGYLLKPPAMTEFEYKDKIGKKEDDGYANTAGKSQQQLVEYLASYISNHIGYNNKTGEIGYMPFDNTLKDWLKFDVSKWTPYDLTVSSMLAVVGANAFSKIKKKEYTPIQLWETFNNSGNMSERIIPKR